MLLPIMTAKSACLVTQARTFLRNARVAIVGLGEVRSLLAEYLARLGVGHFSLIDPDRIDLTNLPRVVGATRFDARAFFAHPDRPAWMRRLAFATATPRVKIAKRIIRRANRRAKVNIFQADVLEPAVAAKLLALLWQNYSRRCFSPIFLLQ